MLLKSWSLIWWFWSPSIGFDLCEFGGVLLFYFCVLFTMLEKCFTFFAKKITKLIFLDVNVRCMNFLYFWFCYFLLFFKVKYSLWLHISPTFESLHLVFQNRTLIIGMKKLSLRCCMTLPYNLLFLFEIDVSWNNSS